MLTTLLLAIALQTNPVPVTVNTTAVQHPELVLPAPDWAFIPLPSWGGPSAGVASLMFAVDIDPTELSVSEEREDLDIYAEDVP